MTMFSDDDDEEQEHPHFEMSPTTRAAADALLEKRSELEDTLRTLGLYMDDINIVLLDNGRGAMTPALTVGATIGDIAWSDRVQHPENYGMDQQFRVMEREMTANDHVEIVERMKRNIAAGRDPLDDGDDEDLGD